ncbi:hypothetical protein P153DRAFT_380226 [Dothidotthia symphoricarpi CBS 119687]|uniref:Fungal N-terminal domain-containing protein n=1 Tax=Dothidotthia symphoricarpi CBS 119687 TaxID=1392245 RepID=A0A6A6AT72_9PLEO|nr:uncharacterized protein P153DRAFT_380226 [Dothidotthia symphoricarpi CBS 119687]KAF2134413.1 hypothetical protein P153DRAFT_380226 [Dothidotthia symphoricarpi CBS 119687]
MEASLALSITASVLRIVTISVEAAKKLNDIRCAWTRAPVTVSSLCSQLKLTAASLSQIQSLLLNDDSVLMDKPDLMATFDTTLTASLVLSTWLEKYIQKITMGILDGSKSTWKMKFKTLWNEDEVKELSQQLHTQQGAISTLVGLLQIDSISEIRTLVRRQEAHLRRIAANTQLLRRTHSIDAPESILSTDKTNDSIFNKLADSEDIACPSNDGGFESVVLSSKVYSKAFTGILVSHPGDEFDDARTIIEGEAANDEALHTPSVSNLMRVSNAMTLAVKNLRIFDICAICNVHYVAANPEELTFKECWYIKNIRKIDASRYSGQVLHHKGKLSPPGIFHRTNVVIAFQVRKSFVASTNRTFTRPTSRIKNLITFNKGDKFDIQEIEHSPLWKANISGGRTDGIMRHGYIWVDMIDVDNSLREDIDTLLRHFSYPHPKIDRTSRQGFQKQVRGIFRNSSLTDWQELGKLWTHCSSLAELQVFTEEFRCCEEKKFGTMERAQA